MPLTRAASRTWQSPSSVFWHSFKDGHIELDQHDIAFLAVGREPLSVSNRDTRQPVLRKTIACAATGNLFIAMQISLNLLFLVQVLVYFSPLRRVRDVSDI
jgi:hypothetical protein